MDNGDTKETKKNNRWVRFIIILVLFTAYQTLASYIPAGSIRTSALIIISSIVILAVGFLFGRVLAQRNIWKMILEISAAGIIGHFLYEYTFLGGHAHATIMSISDVFYNTGAINEGAYVTALMLFGGFIGYASRKDFA